MKLLLFSDLHIKTDLADKLVELSTKADAVIGAGDFAIVHRGLPEIVAHLKNIRKPTFLVPGNGETFDELKEACQVWPEATILHGMGTTWNGVSFYGIGGGIPVTPFGSWSYDFSEQQAKELLKSCPEGGILISHSPPKGILDVSGRGESLGSTAIYEVIEAKKPRLVVCGHIHESSGQTARIDETMVVNAGPAGIIVDL